LQQVTKAIVPKLLTHRIPRGVGGDYYDQSGFQSLPVSWIYEKMTAKP
jgi:hypothetical protein